MITLLKGGQTYLEGRFHEADVLVANGKIERIGKIDESILTGWEAQVVDCRNQYVLPGLIDPHLHLAGGSGEGGGFISQSHRILVSECVIGGTTTLVGTLGVDTVTKTMRSLMASVRAINEAGLTAYAYTGGYDIPPRTLTSCVRDDIIFIPEIIGVGELAIADRRAPEPDLQELAKASIGAYVAGMLTGKAGVTHFHVGAGKKKLQTAWELLDKHEINPRLLYFTHISRNEDLVREAIKLAEHGSFIDFDVCECDLEKWYKYYRKINGPLGKLTFSSDAGINSPSDLWGEIRKCVLEHDFPLHEMLPHATTVSADVLKLNHKGRLQIGKDADLFVASIQDLEIKHVMSLGRWLYFDRAFHFPARPYKGKRGFDLYEISKN